MSAAGSPETKVGTAWLTRKFILKLATSILIYAVIFLLISYMLGSSTASRFRASTDAVIASTGFLTLIIALTAHFTLRSSITMFLLAIASIVSVTTYYVYLARVITLRNLAFSVTPLIDVLVGKHGGAYSIDLGQIALLILIILTLRLLLRHRKT